MSHSTSEKENGPPIELLTEYNYDTWKEDVKILLEENNLWEYIEGDASTSSTKTVPVKEYVTWKEKDAEAKTKLIELIDDNNSEMLSDVKHCATSRDVWAKLEKSYKIKRQLRKAIFLEKLTAFPVMKEDDDLQASLEQFFAILDELVTMGVEVEKNIVIPALLHMLPPSFKAFNRSVLSSDEFPELPDLIQEILEYANDRNEDQGIKDQPKDLEQNGKTERSSAENVRSEQQQFILDKFFANEQEPERNPCLDYGINQTIDSIQLSDRPAEKKCICGICGMEGHSTVACLRNILDLNQTFDQIQLSDRGSSISRDPSLTAKKKCRCGICGIEGHTSAACLRKIYSKDSSGPVKKKNRCGLCHLEGHNRTTCALNKANQSVASSTSSKRTVTCGLCGREGHNRRTCSMNSSSQSGLSSTSSAKRTVTCGLCGLEGHNSATCIRKIAKDTSATVKKTVTCGLCGCQGHNRTTCSKNSANQSVASSISTARRTQSCGLCGREGHNRTTCVRNSDNQSFASSSFPSIRRTVTCGLCGREGHNRTTCSMNDQSRASPASFYSGASSGVSSYSCGICGGSGHNRRTCSLNTDRGSSSLFTSFPSSMSSISSSSSTRSYSCGTCGGQGHNSRTCSLNTNGGGSSFFTSFPSSMSSISSSSSTRRSYTCGTCGGQGHNSRTCR